MKNMEKCDLCRTELIDMCLKCGAPVCCPKCCAETEPPQTSVKSGCESKDNPFAECATGMYYGGGWDNETGFQIGGKGEVDDKFSFCPFCGKPVNA